jgi:hypothetical protein
LSGGASEEAPPLSVSQLILLLAGVRLALGTVGPAAAVAIDLPFGTALAEAGVGAGLTIFRAGLAGREAAACAVASTRAGANSAAPVARPGCGDMFPSTYGVARLTAIALGFNRDLAAFLAGVLIGLGAVPLVYTLSRLKVRL